MTKKKTSSEGGLAIGGDLKADAGRDVNIAGGDIWKGSLAFDADWRDSAMTALGDAQVSPVARSHVDRQLDQIEAELAKPEPEFGLLQRLVGEVEIVVPLVASALHAALPFLR